MVKTYVQIEGLGELIENLRSLTERNSDFIFYLKNAAQRGTMLIAQRAVGNAASLGLGNTDYVERPNPDGGYQRYGRIPNSIFVSKPAYTRTYAVLVKAYVRKRPGIRKDAAPHANLIEFGFTGGGRARKPHVAGRPFMGPALAQENRNAVDRMAEILRQNIERLTFPNPPK